MAGQSIALRSEVTGRWLDNDRNGAVNQSVLRRVDDVWRVEDAGGGYVYLVNDATGRRLDADPATNNVDSSFEATSEKRWDLQVEGDVVAVRNVRLGGFLTALGYRDGFDTVRQPQATPATRWTLSIIG